MQWKQLAKRGGIAILALGVLIQLIPGGRNHDNPPVTQEPDWDSPRTRELAAKACFDCHSNETVWPWYSNIAPASFFVQGHVDEGRSMLNFSEWDKPQKYADEAARAVLEGWMPLDNYLWVHGHAELTADEVRDLGAGFEKMFGMRKPAKPQN